VNTTPFLSIITIFSNSFPGLVNPFATGYRMLWCCAILAALKHNCMNQSNYLDNLQDLPKGAKILFATFPADGHFNPLTGLAVHLKEQGYDVRWYTSKTYEPKLEKMGIPFFPFKKALEVTGDNVDAIFPERKNKNSQVAKLNFDIVNVFINRSPEYYQDIKGIHQHFAFDLMICDVLFTGMAFVSDLMKIPVVGVGIVPVTSDSKDLAPAGLAMTPSNNFFGRRKQDFLRWMAKNVLFAKANKAMKNLLTGYGIESISNSVFDMAQEKCTIILQTGTPGFEYKRSDLSPKYKFVGPLLLPPSKKAGAKWHNEKLAQYKKVLLVTQGTVEKDNSKLLVPTLEALQNTDYLLVVTTGGSNTEALRKQYTAPNIIIEDYIAFADVMPHTDVYVTNGGMGGVQLSIQNNLPMVTAGVHEGKNEICARVGYFNLGINLKTERPSPEQIRKAVEQVVSNGMYRKNVIALNKEFGRYRTNELCERYVESLLPRKVILQRRKELADRIY
jgi:MGT family glycosyltransferase